MDTSHLVALENSLSNERQRLKEAKSDKERQFREHNIEMIKKEIQGEYEFLGISKDTAELLTLSDDEVLQLLRM